MKSKSLVFIAGGGSLLLSACMSPYYKVEQKKTDKPISQLMERADQTFVREFDRLDLYCRSVLKKDSESFSDLDPKSPDYRHDVCKNMRDYYRKDFRSEEFRRIRLEALMYERFAKTVGRLGRDRRDFDGMYSDGQEVKQPVLNRLYRDETRVDIMMYEWSRVQKELAQIQSLEVCLEDRDFSQKWDGLLEHFHVKPDRVLYQEACDIWQEGQKGVDSEHKE